MTDIPWMVQMIALGHDLREQGKGIGTAPSGKIRGPAFQGLGRTAGWQYWAFAAGGAGHVLCQQVHHGMPQAFERLGIESCIEIKILVAHAFRMPGCRHRGAHPAVALSNPGVAD